ncbi:MAG: nitroreductase family protein [Lachnospiraceae bacterium]|nr:nitroreductase family protein [Lachnospiraceae bacterium]
MNSYQAIFQRKSIRKYKMEPILPETLKKIGSFYQEIEPLFPGMQTEIGITENLRGGKVVRGLFSVKAPYYLSIYSEERDRADMNAGYIMQQISLYLCTLGLGSCYMGAATMVHEPEKRGNKKFIMLMAFGRPQGTLTRRPEEARRLPMKELCSTRTVPKKWMREVLDAARMAPSSANSQPWRFAVAGSRIHIFTKNKSLDSGKNLEEFNFGVMFANIMVASEELWLDVDLIRLEDISQKSFHSSQYVLSAVIKPPSWESEESELQFTGHPGAEHKGLLPERIRFSPPAFAAKITK